MMPPAKDLLASLSSQLSMDGVVRFREGMGDWLYVDTGELLTLFRPKPKRPIGGRINQRVLSGDLGLAVKPEHFASYDSRTLLDPPPTLAVCPVINLPRLVSLSTMDDDGQISQEFVRELKRLLGAMPKRVEDLQSVFGGDLLALTPLERLTALVVHLRST